MYNDIKVFAADHRSNVDWNLPYIRLGNCQSDSTLKITTIPILWHKQLGEIAQAIDIKNRWKEFGSPNYLGLCHYRRFFTLFINENSKTTIYDLTQEQFQPQLCCTPIQQLQVLKKLEADILCFSRIRSYKEEERENIHSTIDELEQYGKRININMTRQQIETVFDIFYKKLPNSLKDYFNEAVKRTTVHCCNIFTSKANIFCDWASLIELTYKECKEAFDDNAKHSFNPRWFGYIAERLTSIYLDCCQLSGLKKTFLPLLSINGTTHST